MFYVLKAWSPLGDSLGNLDIGFSLKKMMGPLVNTYDSLVAQEVFQKMKERNFFVTSTLFVWESHGKILETDHTADSLLDFIGPGIIKTYSRRIEAAKKQNSKNKELKIDLEINKIKEDLETRFRGMIIPMHKAGVNILAGSDCGPYNSYMYSGESLYGELKSLVEAGLSTQEALQTSIINGPKFFDLENYYGSVGKGKIADLILLNKNPLDDIENISEISTVVSRGKVYNPKIIDELMEGLKTKYKKK